MIIVAVAVVSVGEERLSGVGFEPIATTVDHDARFGDLLTGKRTT